MKKTAAVLKVTALALALAIIAAGSLAVYYFTLPPLGSASPGTAPLGSSGSSASVKILTNLAQGGQFITVVFNGTSYQVPQKGPNSPSFACPVGADPSICSLLAQTCGNGVGSSQEPWKTCQNCVFDAGCTGNQSCDPYTHSCSTPATACMVAIYGGG